VTVEYLDLADSALHAPAAGFGETDFYPDLCNVLARALRRLGPRVPSVA